MLGELLSNSYSQSSFMSLNLSDVNLFNNFFVSDITFTDCIFTNVRIYINNIEDATFISCKFYNCEIEELIKDTNSLIFLNCFDNNGLIEDIESFEIKNEVEDESQVVDELTSLILNRFWRVGSASLDRLHIPLASIIKAGQSHGYSKRQITLKLKMLKKLSFLEDANDGEYIAINLLKIAEVKAVLGK